MGVKKADINVEVKCPELHPNSNPEDKKLIMDFYSMLDTRLIGIEHDMELAKCEEIVITIKPGRSSDEAGN